jgi:hypothetical protein
LANDSDNSGHSDRIPGIPVEFGKSDSLLILVVMFSIDYQSFVLAEYMKKKSVGDLSHRIRDLTPAKLKEECEVVCKDRYDSKDAQALEAFFKYVGDKEACLQAIGKCDIDKFRPLINFLKGSTTKPDPKIVELLAWMIDFKPRPLESAKKAHIGHPDVPITKWDKTAKVEDEKPKRTGSVKRFFALKARKVMMAGVILLIAALVLYWVWPGKADVPKRLQGCMYWTGDHYQPISCGQMRGDTLVVPLDPEKMAHFKKITRADTITENALGSIWYAKYNGVYECYTSPGYHPIDTSLQLRLLTDYVLIKHIHPNQEPGKSSE